MGEKDSRDGKWRVTKSQPKMRWFGLGRERIGNIRTNNDIEDIEASCEAINFLTRQNCYQIANKLCNIRLIVWAAQLSVRFAACCSWSLNTRFRVRHVKTARDKRTVPESWSECSQPQKHSIFPNSNNSNLASRSGNSTNI